MTLLVPSDADMSMHLRNMTSCAYTLCVRVDLKFCFETCVAMKFVDDDDYD